MQVGVQLCQRAARLDAGLLDGRGKEKKLFWVCLCVSRSPLGVVGEGGEERTSPRSLWIPSYS